MNDKTNKDPLSERRCALAEALRKGNTDGYITCKMENDIPTKSDNSGSLCVPQNIYGDYYNVMDSMNETHIVLFVNRCRGWEEYYRRKRGIDIPPESHGKKIITIEIDDETTDVMFQLLRYSAIGMDIRTIKEKFKIKD